MKLILKAIIKAVLGLLLIVICGYAAVMSPMAAMIADSSAEHVRQAEIVVFVMGGGGTLGVIAGIILIIWAVVQLVMGALALSTKRAAPHLTSRKRCRDARRGSRHPVTRLSRHGRIKRFGRWRRYA
jgi:hypothetical protein